VIVPFAPLTEILAILFEPKLKVLVFRVPLLTVKLKKVVKLAANVQAPLPLPELILK